MENNSYQTLVSLATDYCVAVTQFPTSPNYYSGLLDKISEIGLFLEENNIPALRAALLQFRSFARQLPLDASDELKNTLKRFDCKAERLLYPHQEASLSKSSFENNYAALTAKPTISQLQIPEAIAAPAA